MEQPASDSTLEHLLRQTVGNSRTNSDNHDRKQVTSSSNVVHTVPYPGPYKLPVHHTTTSSHEKEQIRSRGGSRLWTSSFLILSGWWIEIICFLVVCLSLLAIFITLYLHEGQPLPQWHFAISLNTLIAIYALIFKAAILLITAQGKIIISDIGVTSPELMDRNPGLNQLKWAWFYHQPRRLIDLSRIDDASRGPWGALKLIATMRLR